METLALQTASASSGVAGALTTIAGDITTTVGQIAPIAVGVVGVFLVWKFGMKFFKGLSK